MTAKRPVGVWCPGAPTPIVTRWSDAVAVADRQRPCGAVDVERDVGGAEPRAPGGDPARPRVRPLGHDDLQPRAAPAQDAEDARAAELRPRPDPADGAPAGGRAQRDPPAQPRRRPAPARTCGAAAGDAPARGRSRPARHGGHPPGRPLQAAPPPQPARPATSRSRARRIAPSIAAQRTTVTGVPRGTVRISRRRSRALARAQPFDAARPRRSGAGVPWIARRTPASRPRVWLPLSASAQQP